MKYHKLASRIAELTPLDEYESGDKLTPEQIEKIKTTSEIILTVIGALSVLSLTILMPNAAGALAKMLEKRYPERHFTRSERATKLTKAFYYLKRSGKIKMKITKNDVKIFLTKLGRQKLKKIDFETMSVKRPLEWDGKWWQVAADIPTKKFRLGADQLRLKLRSMKFFPLQRTLWFYPYDPRKEVEYLARYFGIAQFVTVMEINRLDKSDEKIMKVYFRKQSVLN